MAGQTSGNHREEQKFPIVHWKKRAGKGRIIRKTDASEMGILLNRLELGARLPSRGS
jgi:hypothetical protein